MASYQIVRQIEQPGFLQGLGQGIPKGTDTFLEQMLPRIMKQRDAVASEEKATGERNAYIDALKKQGFEESDATVGKGGISRRFSKPKVAESSFNKDPAKAIKEALLGITSPEEIGEVLNIAKPTPYSPEDINKFFPIAQMTGQTENLNTAGKPYGNVVQDALRERFAGGASNAVIGRDYLGLPQAKDVKAEIPKEFTDEIQGLKTSSEGDVDVFVAGLNDLKLKYVDNPEVLKRIKLILQTINE